MKTFYYKTTPLEQFKLTIIHDDDDGFPFDDDDFPGGGGDDGGVPGASINGFFYPVIVFIAIIIWYIADKTKQNKKR